MSFPYIPYRIPSKQTSRYSGLVNYREKALSADDARKEPQNEMWDVNIFALDTGAAAFVS